MNSGDGVIDVVTTTPILGDIAANIAGDHARVTPLIPGGSDPHTYQPTLRSIRDVANADAGLSVNLFLEDNALIRVLDSNLQRPAEHVRVAEQSGVYSIRLKPLVEDFALDTAWLGLRIHDAQAATSARSVTVRVEDFSGPGQASAFITGTFGQPEVLFNSDRDGGERLVLPAGAHTHLNWLFSTAGVYHVTLVASFADGQDIGRAQVTFAVGVDPFTTEGLTGRTVIDEGHQDVTFFADGSQPPRIAGDCTPRDDDSDRSTHIISLTHAGHDDHDHGHDHGDGHGEHDQHNVVVPAGEHDICDGPGRDPNNIVVVVPATTLDIVPADPRYRSVGRPGHQAFMLRQAVIGKHVHGRIDPHVWLDVSNAMAMAQRIRDQLVAIDPANAPAYSANTRRYLDTLSEVDREVRERLATIPESRRYLVTTHDAYGYLADAYGLSIAGFVTPNPAVEPSPRDLMALSEALDNLHIPAVFVEPNMSVRARDLLAAARTRGIAVCPLYGDTFDDQVTSFAQMMRFNAESIATCLGQDTS